MFFSSTNNDSIVTETFVFPAGSVKPTVASAGQLAHINICFASETHPGSVECENVVALEAMLG